MMEQALSQGLHEMHLAVHHLRQKWWWWWSVLTPRRSVLVPRLSYAWVLQDGWVLYVLLFGRWYILLKVEGGVGRSSSSVMAMATTRTTASGQGERGATVWTFRAVARPPAANVRS